MEIQINNQSHHISEGTTVCQLICNILQLDTAGIALAINDQIVPRHFWESHQFQSRDTVLIIKAARGG
jgi:sulfur carrier protein